MEPHDFRKKIIIGPSGQFLHEGRGLFFLRAAGIYFERRVLFILSKGQGLFILRGGACLFRGAAPVYLEGRGLFIWRGGAG